MRADNTHHMLTAAQQRSAAARHRADAALEELARAGAPTTVAAFVRSAKMSRSWLYAQLDVLAQLKTLRQMTDHDQVRSSMPTAASEGSLLRRLEVAQQRIRELDNIGLNEQLASAFGHVREQRRHLPPMHGSAEPADT